MSFQPKVYTMGHILGMTGMVAFATAVIYARRHEQPGLLWFMENWGLYIGAASTVITFLFGLSILGKPWYDETTNKQLEADHNRLVFEWNCKSPEERAILAAAEENRLLQLTQILQNNQIINNQEQLKNKLKG